MNAREFNARMDAEQAADLAEVRGTRWERTKLIAQMACSIICAEAERSNTKTSFNAPDYVEKAQTILAAAEAAEAKTP